MRFRNILILFALLFIFGGYYYFGNVPEPAEKKDPQLFAWLFEMEELEYIEIQLPRDGEGQSFFKDEERAWHFDDAQESNVDMKRWGGGIPLLLSGPGVERVIVRNATEEELIRYGLTQPKMKITLVLEDGSVLHINIGDSSPSRNTYYVQAPGTTDVALVDYTWYDELARLVKDPPYIQEEE